MKKKRKSGLMAVANFRDKLTVLASILIIFGTIFTGWMFLENRYAQKKVETKLDYLNYTIEVQSLNEQIQKLMALYPDIANAPDTIKQQLNILSCKKAEDERLIQILAPKVKISSIN